MKKSLTLIAALLFLGVLNLFSQELKSDSLALAKIEFTELNHDFGTIEYEGNGTHEFVFRNTGTQDLILLNVRSSCGCTIPTWPREAIHPGNKASIKVKYDTKRVGSFSKTITVYSNATETPVSLHIKGTVKPQ